MNHDYEKIGAFYLGKEYDLETRARGEDLVLVDAKDFTTHAVIIGMTGSGKTGLGIGLIEEAAIDQIPVIAIDPKGDLANIALTFPKLRASDFAPWVNAQQANSAEQSVDAFAADMAERWRTGLESWGQDGVRIQRLRDAADVTVYTPGSTAGRPISLLKGFAAPPPVVRDDAEALAERITATATGLLALLDIDADPIASREHVLLSNLLAHFWRNGTDLDLPALIGAIQSPPFPQIGVMPVDTVFPSRDRSALAMRLNNLLAAPGFQAWMQGDPLDAGALLHTPAGKPRISVISIAHLSDAERMFLVSMLLVDLIAWMRQQPGTGSLRALLYIDELFGYMPPVANPPSKQLLLTLLKQARAYGLGVVLSTQNPVDLDYKGLSNAGLWFIGRLQTEQDKARVMDGLAGASGNTPFDRSAMERTIAGLGKRVFLQHSIYENAPTIFETRWVMSYLAGPMTREQIRALPASGAVAEDHTTPAPTADPAVNAAPVMTAEPPDVRAPREAANRRAPVLAPEIPQLWLPTTEDLSRVTWRPAVLGAAVVDYTSSKFDEPQQRSVAWLVPLDDDDQLVLEWSDGEPTEVDVNALSREAQAGAAYEPPPALATNPKQYATWARELQRHIATSEPIILYQSKTLKLVSAATESEGAFRARLQLAAREATDAKVESLRQKYAVRLNSAQEKVRRTALAIETKESAATQSKISTAISVGSAVLGALFSRKKFSVGNVGKIGTAARSASRTQQRAGSVERAEANHQAAIEAQAALEAKIAAELGMEEEGYVALADELERLEIRPKRSDIQVQAVALAWVPWATTSSGGLVRG